ncbi:MAG: peptidoglycan DD-metalloendopeptidase family protein [Desulfobacteraceae bacterium]|nr:peptidoglycan DD-metalloendopeptidase family protein [Desulfobacteraceae bacterium]
MIKKINILIFLSIVLLILPCITLAATSVEYEYDANGNLIQGVGKYYEYNDANKLVRVRHGDESGPVIAEYFYDSNGQRVKKIENGATTYYIGKYFEKQIEGKQPGESSYYFANSQRVARKDPDGKMFYFHADHLGGTNVITDSAGSLVERIRYYPFGEIREGGNERYSYTGKEKDKVTDFYYFEARHYNLDYRHFTQADTIAPDIYDPQNLNRYTYVRNNPLKFIDPSGNKEEYFFQKQYVKGAFAQKDQTINMCHPDYATDPSMFPISLTESFKKWTGAISSTISEDSDYHNSYIRNAKKEYYQVDIGSTKDYGTPIRAFEGGEIIDVDTEGKGLLGKWIKIKTPDGEIDLYGHLQSIKKEKGAQVTTVDEIGTLGNTGSAILTKDYKTGEWRAPTERERASGRGSHLHFQRKDKYGNLIDPWR